MSRTFLLSALSLLFVGALIAQPKRDGAPPAESNLFEDMSKLLEALAGTWYFSDCDGPDAFYHPGRHELPNHFKGLKLVFAGENVTIHDGKNKDEQKLQYSRTVKMPHGVLTHPRL